MSSPNSVQPHVLCKLCRLPSNAPGYDDLIRVMTEHLSTGGTIAGLHRRIAERFFVQWPEAWRFSYDGLHNHLTRHVGLDAMPYRSGVIREAQRNEALVGVIGEAYEQARTDVDRLVAFARARLEEGDLTVTLADAIRIARLRIQLEDATLKTEITRLESALALLVDVVGPSLNGRATDQVLAKLHELEGRGSEAALLLLDWIRPWNRLPSTRDGEQDDRLAG